MSFRNIASHVYPALLPIIDAYLDLAERSDSDVEIQAVSLPTNNRGRTAQMHLFDLLREKKFFPLNRDLAQFASRVLPHLRTHRFDKVSRGDIAARIIEHIEESEPSARSTLEESMREALLAMKRKPTKEADRKSFLSKWERIIKGLEL